MAAVVALDPNQHIARIEHARRLDALAATHLDHGFGWHQDLRDRAFQFRAGDASFQAFTNLLLVPGISMKNEPLLHLETLSSASQPRSQMLDYKRPYAIDAK